MSSLQVQYLCYEGKCRLTFKVTLQARSAHRVNTSGCRLSHKYSIDKYTKTSWRESIKPKKCQSRHVQRLFLHCLSHFVIPLSLFSSPWLATVHTCQCQIRFQNVLLLSQTEKLFFFLRNSITGLTSKKIFQPYLLPSFLKCQHINQWQKWGKRFLYRSNE